jgi:hypothetical protein
MRARTYAFSLALISVLLVAASAIPFTPVSAAGLLVMDSSGGPAGSYVTAQGTGFAGSSSYTIRFGTGTTYNQIVATGTVGGDGSFLAYFVVPSFPRSTYTVTATTDISANTASATFAISSIISCNYSSGKVGDQLTINGSGFTGSYKVNVYFDDGAMGVAYTDAYGSFTMGITVPETYKGNHSIKVQDDLGFSPALGFTVNPSITVNPGKVAVGGQISVSGKGFTASSTINFTLDGTALNTSASTTTNTLGTIALTALTIPPVPAGDHTLKIADGSGLSLTTTVNVSNSITISPQNGPSGTTITITGSGFEVNTAITIAYSGSTVNTSPSAITSDGRGNFTAAIVAPKIPSGTYVITASDSTNTAAANFISSSTVSATVTRGEVGSSVPVSGGGFDSGADIVIRLDNIQIATAKADTSGAFSTSVIIPAGKSGVHNILITDGTNSNTIPFTIDPAARFSPDSGDVGTEITIKGYSFKGGGTINIKYDSVQVATASADLNGTFSATFKAPPSSGGNHVITVSDGDTVITSNFAMESTSPSVPELITPEEGARADALAKFQWQPVSDPSGVTYNLQIAGDANFNNPLIDKTGLGSAGYELTQGEKLRSAGSGGPYYWRVQAVDSASNASAWSDPHSFTVGFTMPSWGWYLIVATGAIIIFALGVFLGRSLSRRAI